MYSKKSRRGADGRSEHLTTSSQLINFPYFLWSLSLSLCVRFPSQRPWSRWILRSISSLTLPSLSQVPWGIWLSFPQMTLRSSTHPGNVAQWYKLSLRKGKSTERSREVVVASVVSRCGLCLLCHAGAFWLLYRNKTTCQVFIIKY